MDKKLRGVLKSKFPVLCDVKVDENQKVIPKLEFGREIQDLSPRLNQEEMNLNMIK